MALEIEQSDLLNAIYEAALQPEVWPVALTKLGKLLRSTWMPMGALRYSGGADLVVQQEDGDPAHLAFFRENYSTPETNPSIPLALGYGPGSISLSQRDMTEPAWRACGLYREVFQPLGLYYGSGAFLLKTDSHIVMLGVNRPKRGGPFNERELEILGGLMPHFRQAVQTFLKLADLESHKAAHEATWDLLPFGVVLLDAQQRILWMNVAANDALSCADGLRACKSRLSAASRNEDAALQLTIQTAVTATGDRRGSAGGMLNISRPSLKRPFALQIAPIREARSFANRPAAVVFIHDPGRRTGSAPELLRQLFGLTWRESMLASLLLQGLDLSEAADRLEMTMNTARTHLKFIFDKTGTHRQAELVHLLLRGPAGIL